MGCMQVFDECHKAKNLIAVKGEPHKMPMHARRTCLLLVLKLLQI